MSSKDDTTSKTAADLYTKVMGEDQKPDYPKFMTYAFKQKNEALVNGLLHKGKEFDSKDKVMGLLESHLAKQQTQGVAATKPKTWVERVKSNNGPDHSKKR